MSVNNLEDGVTHEFRIYGRNSFGTIEQGDILELTTSDIATVETGEASNVNPRSATLNGELKDLGLSTLVEVGFQYDGSKQTSFTEMSSAGSFSETVSELNQDQFYDYRATVRVFPDPYEIADMRNRVSVRKNIDEEGDPEDLAFNDDGTKLFVGGRNNNTVYEYELSEPYSFGGSVTYTGNSLQTGNQVGSLEFNADGTNLFVADRSGGLVKYDLESAYSLSGNISQVANIDNSSFSFSGDFDSIRFSNDGTKLFTISNGSLSPTLYELSLANPFDLSNVTENGSFDLQKEDDSNLNSIAFDDSGNRLFAVQGGIFDFRTAMYEYSLDTSFDISTISFSKKESRVGFEDPTSFRFDQDGRRLLFTDISGGNLVEKSSIPSGSSVTKTLYTPFKDFNVETREADNVDSTSVRFNGRLDSLGDRIGRFSRRQEVADADLTFQYRDADSTPQPYELGTAGTFRFLRYDEGEGDGFGDNFDEFSLSDVSQRFYRGRIGGMTDDGSKVYRVERDQTSSDDKIFIHQFALGQNFDIRTVTGRDTRYKLSEKQDFDRVSMIRFYENGSVATVRLRGNDSSNTEHYWFYKIDLSTPYDFTTVTNVTETSIDQNELSGQNLNLDFNDNPVVFFSAGGGRSIIYNEDRRHFQLYDNNQNYVFEPSEQNLVRTFDFGLNSMERGFYSNGKLYVIDNTTLGERVWHQFSVPTDFDFSNTQLGFESQVLGGVGYDGFFRVDQGTYSGNSDRIVVDGGNQIISENAEYTSLEWNSSSRINENNINTNRSINEDNLRDGTNFEFNIVGKNNQGDVDKGSIKTFTTDDLPTVTTSDITNLGPKSVTLNGNLEDLGGETSVDVGFEIVKDDNASFSNSPNWSQIGNISSKTAAGTYSQTVTVEQDFFYLVRAKVETGSNTYYGKAVRFQTPIKPFTIQTKSADLDGQKATIEGRLDSKGRRGSFETDRARRQIQAQNAYVTFRYREQGQEEDPYDFRQGGFIGQFDLQKIRDNNGFIDNAQDRIRFGGFNPAGDKVYLFTEDISNDFRVGQYTLSENYDIASVNGKEAELLIDSNITYYNINPLRFYQNGSVAASTYRNESFKIDLNTPYDLRDGGSVTTRNHSTNSGTLVYSEDGSRALFQRDDDSERIRLFENINTNYVLDVEEGDNSTREFRFPETEFRDFNFHYELISGGDDKLYIFPEDDNPDERVLQYSVSTRFDLTTRSFEAEETIGTPYLGQGDARRKNYKFEDGGRRMYSQHGEFFDLRWNVTNEQARRPSETRNEAIRNYDARTKTLENGKTYEYQAVGLSSGNFFDTGSVNTFSIPDAPSVSIDSVSDVGRFTATLSGSVEDLGGNSSVDVGFEVERDLDNARFSGNKIDVSSEISSNSDIFFKPDGTRLFVGDFNGNQINQYDLSTAFDVTTASSAGSFDLDDDSEFTNNPYGIHFKPDGKKLFVIDSRDTLQSYELSTAWDITTISSTRLERNDLTETGNQARGLKFKPDGTRFYVLDDNQNVYEYRTDQPWDISGAEFESNQNIDRSSEFFVGKINNSPRGLEISNDGTRLYVGDSNGEDLFVYNFRSPWNVDSLVPYSYVNLNTEGLSISNVIGISTEENGERLFISGNNRNEIYEFEGPYKRETAVQTVTSVGETFEISVSGLAPDSRHKARGLAKTAGEQSFSVNSESFRTEKDVEIETGSAEGETEDAAVVNGTVRRSDFDEVDVAFEWRKKGDAGWNRTYERTFLDQNSRPTENERPETPSEFEERIGDLGSRRLASEDLIGGRFPNNDISGIKFNSDGTKVFVLDDRNNSLVEFELSTGYDFSTASLTGNELSLTNNTNVQGFSFYQNGETLLVVGDNDEATTYDLSTGYDITTAKVGKTEFSLSTDDIRQAAFIDSGQKLLTLSEDDEEFELHLLQKPYNVENPTLISDNLLQNQVADQPKDFLFNGDGTKLIVVSRDTNSDGNRLFEFNLSTPYDLTTANRTTAGSDLTDVTGNVRSVATNGDGTEFFIGDRDEKVYRYTASTGFDLSTVSYDSVVYNGRERNGIVGRVYDIAIGREGSSLFVLEGDSSFQNGQRVSEMPLGTDYDVSTRQQVSASKEFVTNNVNPEYIEFTDGGRRMYVLNDNDRDIEEFELSTPWDVTTISRVGRSQPVNDRDSSDLHFGDQGKRAYITRRGDDYVNEIYLNEPYQLSNFSSDFANTIDAQNQFPSSFLNHRRLRLNNVVSTDFNEDGTRFYYANSYNGESQNTIAASNLDRPWATTTHNRSKWAFSANMREYESIKDMFVEENDKLFAVSSRFSTRLRKYDISPLQGSTTYEYRALAIAGGDEQSQRKNINRLEVFGDVKEFTTAPDVAVSTNAESGLEPQSASFNGEVTESGFGAKIEESFESSSVGTDVATLDGWTVPEDADAGWEVTDKSKAVTDGNLAIKSKNIGDNGVAAIEKDFPIKGGGEIKFDWNTSSGNNDFLKVFVNGNRILREEFEDSGTKTHQVDSPDSYTIRFEYDKDGAGTRNDDTVYIDNLQADSVSDPKTAIEFRDTSTGEVRVTQGRPASESAFSVQRGAYDIETLARNPSSEIDFTEVKSDSSLSITEAKMGEAGRYVHVLTGDRSQPTELYQYALESAYDLSTATYQGKQFELQETAQGRIWYGDGGRKAYFVEDSSSQGNFSDRHIRQYDLDNQYDFSGAVRFTGRLTSEAIDDNNTNRTINNIQFNGDGTTGFVTDGRLLVKYSMNSPYEINGATQEGSFSSQPNIIEDERYWEFADEGAAIISRDGRFGVDSIVKHELNAPYDITGTDFFNGTETQSIPVRAFGSNAANRNFVDGGKRLFKERRDKAYAIHNVALEPNTEYSYKAVIRTTLNRNEGSDVTFTTPQIINVETKNVNQ